MAKNLVLYFSVYGTAKAVAEEIAKQAGADLVEIEPETPYDSNRDHYNALAAYAKKEHDENLRPAIKNELNIAAYDNIFIGYPMWWYTFPMIIYTLFDKYDFSRMRTGMITRADSQPFDHGCQTFLVVRFQVFAGTTAETSPIARLYCNHPLPVFRHAPD